MDSVNGDLSTGLDPVARFRSGQVEEGDGGPEERGFLKQIFFYMGDLDGFVCGKRERERGSEGAVFFWGCGSDERRKA